MTERVSGKAGNPVHGSMRRIWALLFCAMLLFSTGCGGKPFAASGQGGSDRIICNNTRLSDEDTIKQIASFLFCVTTDGVTTANSLSFTDSIYILRTMLVHTDAIIDDRVAFDDPVISIDDDTANEYIRLLFGRDLPSVDPYYTLSPHDSTDTEFGVRDGKYYFGTGWWNLGKYQYGDGETRSIDYRDDGTIAADIVFHPRDWLDSHVMMTLIPADTAFRFQIISFENIDVDTWEEDAAGEGGLYAETTDSPGPESSPTPADDRLAKAIAAEDSQDYAASFALYSQLADEGNAYAQYCLGEAYRYGYGVKVDSEKSFYWYTLAAENGEAYGQVNLGLCYRDGFGARVDYERMLYWFVQSAQQGNPSGLINLGYCYHKGIGVEVNLEEAKKLYEMSDAAGHPYAKTRLAEVNALLNGG